MAIENGLCDTWVPTNTNMGNGLPRHPGQWQLGPSQYSETVASQHGVVPNTVFPDLPYFHSTPPI